MRQYDGWDFTYSLEMKPAPDKPWCKNCRDHTPNETQLVNTSTGSELRGASKIYRCLECGGTEVFIHSSLLSGGCVLGCLSALLFPFSLLALWLGSWMPLIIAGGLSITPTICLLFANYKTNGNYAIWYAWAKENGYNEQR